MGIDIDTPAEMAGDRRERVSRGRAEARRMRARAEAAAKERTDAARRRLGERAIDAVAEQFPREFRARRRNDVAMGVLAGVVAGFLVRELLGDR